MDINKCNIPQKACYREEGNEKWAVVAQRSDGFCLKWTKRSSAKKSLFQEEAQRCKTVWRVRSKTGGIILTPRSLV